MHANVITCLTCLPGPFFFPLKYFFLLFLFFISKQEEKIHSGETLLHVSVIYVCL